MGLLSVLFGRKRLPASKLGGLGAVAAAELTMGTELGMEPGNKAGLAIRTMASSRFEQLRTDVERVLQLAARDLGSAVSLRPDDYGYLWAVVADEDFPDLLAAMQVGAQMVAEEGYRDQLLCAVFPFVDRRTRDPVHLVYVFKRGTFYAFAPRAGQTRDTAMEMRVHSILESELPLEGSLENRYPLWGLPMETS
jgi:hypothetical protein